MNLQLWEKIQAFDFDRSYVEYGFTTRLICEQLWTENFTRDAILEYRKFMYLAATSQEMVSPSAIVDIVWHQHLIFTKSYDEFCHILGKDIQHVPSTHNREEKQLFRLAKDRTKRIYAEVFGEQPPEIWDAVSIYDPLGLKETKSGIELFYGLGIFVMLLLVTPVSALLAPVYVRLQNPDFIIGYLIIVALVVAGLELFNRNYYRQTLARFPSYAFLFKLIPEEVIFLRTGKPDNLLNLTMSNLVERKDVVIQDDFTITASESASAENLREHQILDVLKVVGRTRYADVLPAIAARPVFNRVVLSMNALQEYWSRTKRFSLLFYINFAVIALTLIAGGSRVVLGLQRDKPVSLIVAVMLILLVAAGWYLARLRKSFCSEYLPGYYRTEIVPALEDSSNFEWQYFLLGTAVLNSSFTPVVDDMNKSGDWSGDSGGSSSDSSCGSSDGGGGCGGCGGCGGGD